MLRRVLILVFVEFTLRELMEKEFKKNLKSLNPCFCGIYSQSCVKTAINYLKYGLNPCFCGIYSQREANLLEDGDIECLNPCFCGIYSQRMENFLEILKKACLNPCFCGIYSQRVFFCGKILYFIYLFPI